MDWRSNSFGVECFQPGIELYELFTGKLFASGVRRKVNGEIDVVGASATDCGSKVHRE
jgi:hypothetical protein